MADGQNIRPQRESRTELFAAMGVLALLPPYYYLLLAINLPDGLAQVVVSAAGPIVLIMIRFFVVRHRAADREIREAVAGGPAINPVFVCVATAASILFLESIIGATFGAVVGFTNGALSPETDDPQATLGITSLFTTVFTFALLWPITKVATHYLHKRAILWIITAVALSRLMRMSIAVPVLVGAGLYSEDWLLTGTTDFLIGTVVLIPSALIGYFIARRKQATFLLLRAFRKLDPDDREAVLELLVERRGAEPESASITPGRQ